MVNPLTGKNYSFLPLTFKNNSIQTVYFFKENNSSKIYAVGGLSYQPIYTSLFLTPNTWEDFGLLSLLNLEW